MIFKPDLSKEINEVLIETTLMQLEVEMINVFKLACDKGFKQYEDQWVNFSNYSLKRRGKFVEPENKQA